MGFNIDDKKYTDRNGKCTKLDHAWLEVMMCLVGEAFGQNGDLGKHVTGAVCSRRVKKMNRVAVWLTTAYQADEVNILYPIGQVVKKRCARDLPVCFEDHHLPEPARI